MKQVQGSERWCCLEEGCWGIKRADEPAGRNMHPFNEKPLHKRVRLQEWESLGRGSAIIIRTASVHVFVRKRYGQLRRIATLPSDTMTCIPDCNQTT